MNVCEPCLTTWNQHTDPKLLCPVCRSCYGINRPILFSELTHRILYYNQYNAIGQVAIFVIGTGIILFIVSAYIIMKSI